MGSGSDQRAVDEKSNGNWFLKKLNPFSKVSEEIEPSEENPSQSGSGQRTEDEKPNGKASEEIKPSMENLSQSDFVQRTAEEKSNGEVPGEIDPSVQKKAVESYDVKYSIKRFN